jgi:hypothetical protein
MIFFFRQPVQGIGHPLERSGGPKKFDTTQRDQNLVPGLLALPDSFDQMEVLAGGPVLVVEGDNLEEHVHYNTSYQPVCQEYYCS